MLLQILRDECDVDCSLGKMALNGFFECFTLEPPLASIVPECPHPAIPDGTFDVKMQWSGRFQKMVPHIVDVPGRTDIEIHIGCFGRDTHGCVCVGRSRAHDSLLSSAIALGALQPKIASALAHGERVQIQIETPTGAGVTQPT